MPPSTSPVDIDRLDEWRTLNLRRCSATNSDVELCFQTFGESSKPTVLLVMGLNAQGVAWDPNLCRMIADRGFHVVRFDNRDVGMSTKFDQLKCDPMWKLIFPKCFWNPPPYTLSDMAADAVALLDHLKVDRAHWVGVSMGGMISQVAAIEYPERVLSLTSIMSTTGNPSLPEPPLWVSREFLRGPATSSIEDIIEWKVGFYKKVLMHNCRKDDTYLRARAGVSTRRTKYQRGVVRQLMAIRCAPCRDDALSKLKVPSLIIHGDRDVLVPPAHGIHTGSMIPGAKTVIVDSMGHYLGPDEFDVVIDELVALASRAGGAKL